MSDQQQFAQGVVNSTLDTLRDQKDLNGQVDIYDSLSFAPSAIPANNHLILGPFDFAQTFVSVPYVTFGQTSQKTVDIIPQQQVSQQIPNIVPFLVMPYVYQFRWNNGAVDGFWVGLYALTTPRSTTNNHTVFWRAVGQGSRYNDQDTSQPWSQSYDTADTGFLEEQPDYSDADTIEFWNS